MKRALAVISALLLSNIAFPQLWNNLNTGTSTITFSGIDAASPDTVTAVGYTADNKGRISISNDGGISWWDAGVTGTTARLMEVRFADATTGYIAGDSGVVMRSINSGLTWTKLANVTTSDLKPIFFLDASNGFIGGKSGTLIKTTDGGETWINLTDSINTGQFIRSIFFTSLTTGYLTADGGVIKKTTDGGNNWSDHANPFFGFFHGRSVWFTTADSGYIAGLGGKMLKTSDAGNTWQEMGPFTTNLDLHSITFTSSATGYISASSGKVFKSINAGQSWHPADSSITSNNLYSIAFSGTQVGYAAGANGTIIKTTNGATGVNESNPFAGKISVFPNPFSEKVSIHYELKKNEELSVTLYDMSGRMIFNENQSRPAGKHAMVLDAADLSLQSGVYFIELQSAAGAMRHRLIIN